ncbi:FGGY-family carbohydrate kinase [Herbiconiux sp. YIM B11900]|uniref:FGGY-family carbohydrate kinase n=1 Tax=Herbiconiux sp. YIM B11900 TaxID=3404131 RepID=UPI003F85409F
MLPTITVDVGTTSVKLCLFDVAGTLLASARQATPTVTDAWGEIYDVDALWALVTGFVRSLPSGQRALVQRIAITGVGESGGLVRPDGSLASPMILWHDHRGAEYLARLSPADRSLVYRVTGLPVNGNYGLSKAAWAADHVVDGAGPGAASDALDGLQWLNVSEYLAARMTGRRWSEYSLASRTMALDLTTGQWSAEVCGLLGLPVSLFPELRPATSGSEVTAEFAQAAGLADDVVVHVAGHDHIVGAVGAGLAPGELLNSTGTTEGLLLLGAAPVLDEHAERSKLANGLVGDGLAAGDGSEGHYALFASIPTGGSAFQTLQGLLGQPADELTATVARVHERYLAGSLDPRTAPLVLPQFRGSSPPAKNARARGIIAGLSTDATDDDIVFGCFLGLVLQFRDVLALFRAEPVLVKVIGPAGRNPLWTQLKADLLGRPLSVSQFPEVVSRGAQALASGTVASWQDCSPEEVRPDSARTAVLAEWADGVRAQWEYLKGFPA